MFILKTGHQPGVYVPLRALFLVIPNVEMQPNLYILLKKVLHHLIFTTFLSNVLYKYTRNIFFKFNTAVEGWTHCLIQQ